VVLATGAFSQVVDIRAEYAHVQFEVDTIDQADDDTEKFVSQLYDLIQANWTVIEHQDHRLLWTGRWSEERLGGWFYWKDCGGGQDAGHATSLTLSPAPLKIPGQIWLGFDVKLKSDIKAPVSITVEIKKKIAFIFVKVKTLTLADICAVLAQTQCPPKLTNCHCPFTLGDYSMPSTPLMVDRKDIPGGDYHVTIWFKQGSQELGCLYLELSVA